MLHCDILSFTYKPFSLGAFNKFICRFYKNIIILIDIIATPETNLSASPLIPIQPQIPQRTVMTRNASSRVDVPYDTYNRPADNYFPN